MSRPVKNAVNNIDRNKNKKQAKIYNPADGSVTNINMGDKVKIDYYRGLFVVFQ